MRQACFPGHEAGPSLGLRRRSGLLKLALGVGLLRAEPQWPIVQWAQRSLNRGTERAPTTVPQESTDQEGGASLLSMPSQAC
jgi:hypothetical protein